LHALRDEAETVLLGRRFYDQGRRRHGPFLRGWQGIQFGTLEAKGDFTDHEYEFWRQSGLRATVSKQWFAWSDTYGVDIAEGEDDILTLASTVVIDMACHGDQQRR
jgi:hypothetical protein